MKTRIALSAITRDEIGHKSRFIRKQGNIPATIYGKGVVSVSLSIDEETFIEVLKAAGETNVIDLSFDGKTSPVLIHAVQKNPVSRKVLHVEFYVVNLKEKMKTSVPVRVTGESPAVKGNLGTLMTILNEVEIEALPTEIPENVMVDVSHLDAVDSEIKVRELSTPTGVTIITDPEQTVVKIGAIVVEKEPEVVAPTETKEGETTEKPGETSTEEQSTPEKSTKE